MTEMKYFIIEDYVDDYLFRGDDGDHAPNEHEKALIIDAIYGLPVFDELADRDRRLKEIADACMDSEFASSLTEYRLLFRIHKLATGEGR